MIETLNRFHMFCTGCPHMQRTMALSPDSRSLTVSCERYNVCGWVAKRIRKIQQENVLWYDPDRGYRYTQD